MFKPPPDADDAFPLELVGFEDDGELATDVDFGGRHAHRRGPGPAADGRSRRARSKWFSLAIVGVLAFAARMIVDDDGDNRPAAIPATTTVAPTPPLTVPPLTIPALTVPALTVPALTVPASSVPASPVADSSVGRPTTAPSVGPVLNNDRQWGLFLVDGQSRTIKRLDLATGFIAETAAGTFTGFLGISGSGATAAVIQPQDVGGAFSAAPGPDGDIWVARPGEVSGTSLRLLRVHPGSDPEVAGTYQLGDESVFERLIGSMANGDPAFAAPDGSAFVFNPISGVKSRLTTGTMQSAVDHGNFGEVGCDPSGVCQLTLHGGSHTVSLPFTSELSFSISPDGGHALVGGLNTEAADWEMVDLQTGVIETLKEQAGPNGFGPRDGAFAVWAPDGSTTFFINGTHIVEVSSDGMSSRQIELPANFSPNTVLLGIA